MEPRPYNSPVRAEAAERTRARILDAATPLFMAEAYEDVTMRRIAAAADVSLQTVVNHFGSKDALFAAGAERHAAGAIDLRSRSVPDDIARAAAFVVEDYEQMGDVNWRFLVAAERIKVIADALEIGRRGHREWVEATFPGAYAGLTGAARERRIRLLMAATDALTWKMLRRDHGLSKAETVAAFREAVEALYCLNDANEQRS